VCGNNLQITSSCPTFIKLKEFMNCLIWYSGNTSSSGSYLGKHFCGFLGNGCVGPRMSIASMVSQGLYDTMVLEKLQIIQEDEIEVTRVFILENAE
jgi:hypothetical protein